MTKMITIELANDVFKELDRIAKLGEMTLEELLENVLLDFKEAWNCPCEECQTKRDEMEDDNPKFLN